jgi:DNA-binding PadR family transcriptional regulator
VNENRTAYALLGFLARRPMSGYDLKQTIAGSIDNFWSEGYGQIYPMLRRLTAAGWIAPLPGETGTGRRVRRVYEITTAGREALCTWLHEPVAERPPRIELLLKLFFGAEVPLSVSLRHVEGSRASALDSLERYRAIAEKLQRWDASDPRIPFWLLTLDYGSDAMRARIAWCDRAINALRRLAGAAENDPGCIDANIGRGRPENSRLEEESV